MTDERARELSGSISEFLLAERDRARGRTKGVDPMPVGREV